MASLAGGGRFPRWRRDGKELFYMTLDKKLMAVPVTPGSTFEAGSPSSLFEVRAGSFQFAVTADGQRFLVNCLTESGPAPITIILNWQQLLKR